MRKIKARFEDFFVKHATKYLVIVEYFSKISLNVFNVQDYKAVNKGIFVMSRENLNLFTNV